MDFLLGHMQCIIPLAALLWVFTRGWGKKQ
jgi:hypothetical protein